MLGRLVPSRAGSLAVAVKNGPALPQRSAVATVRLVSQVADASGEKSSIVQTIERWDAIKAKYNGPERDLKNFPPPTTSDHLPPVRMGFIPQSWFDFFYDKTGVTGPYVLGGAFLATLLNKEILPASTEWDELKVAVGAWGFVYWKFGDQLRAYQKRHAENVERVQFTEPLEYEKKCQERRIDLLESTIREEERYQYAMDANRENIGLQLEGEYRERLAQVHREVKRRLDYQVELASTRRRLEQEHMVRWIVDGVVEGITPKQEQNEITSCISTLKELSKTQKVSYA